MPRKRKTHEDRRRDVCCVCMGKAQRVLSAQDKDRIQQYHVEGVNYNNIRVPLGCCTTCRVTLGHHSHGQFERRLPATPHNYSSINVSVQTREGSTQCRCLICSISSLEGNSKHPLQIGPEKSAASVFYGPPKPLKICSKCLVPLYQGMRNHKCTAGEKRRNLLDMLASDPKAEEMAASTAISKAIPSPGGTLKFARVGGCHPIKATLGAAVPARRQLFKAEDMAHLQMGTGFSNRGALKIVNNMQEKIGIKLVEKGFGVKFANLGRSFDDHMMTSTVTEKNELKTIVHTKNLSDMVMDLLEERRLDIQEVWIKLGVDKGQGFLKFLVNIVRKSPEDENEAPASQNNNEYKDSGVNCSTICAIAEVEESYSIISTVFELIKANEVFFLFIGDMKAAALALGLGSAASLQPCLWCSMNKHDLIECGNHRTFGGMEQQHEQLRVTGGLAKNFESCARACLIQAGFDETVLSRVPVMELHILLGVANKIIHHVDLDFGEDLLKRVYKILGIVQDPFHGGVLNGNACRKLLRNVDVLQREAPADLQLQLLPYIDALQKFNKVVESCFGRDLDPYFEVSIDRFKDSYLGLHLSITPKLHCLFHHVPQLCTQTGQGLAVFSEQSLESSHRKFKEIWERRFKVANTSELYGSRLLACTCEFNRKRITQ